MTIKTISLTHSNGTISASVGTATPTKPIQHHTISHTNPKNRRWARNIQVTNEFLYIKRYGCPTVGFSIDDLVALAVAQEPKLSWPPFFTQFPKDVTIEAGQSATFTIAVAEGELASVTFQWQTSADDKTWMDISGQTSTTLTVTPTSNGYYRCVATNAANSASTKAAYLNINKPKAPLTTK